MKGHPIALMAALLMTLLCVGLATLVFSSPHSSDLVLTERYLEQEPNFNRLANMVVEDSQVRVIGSSFLALVAADRESEVGFTRERWNEYRSLFKELRLESCRSDKTADVIFFRASIDFGETDGAEQVVTEKGYVYSPRAIQHSLTDSLDRVESDRPAVFFKKLDDNWYLYYEWSVAKPE
jgi:hypothetical protein